LCGGKSKKNDKIRRKEKERKENGLFDPFLFLVVGLEEKKEKKKKKQILIFIFFYS